MAGRVGGFRWSLVGGYLRCGVRTRERRLGCDVSDGDRRLRLSVREKVLIYLTGGITPFLQKVGKFISHVLE